MPARKYENVDITEFVAKFEAFYGLEMMDADTEEYHTAVRRKTMDKVREKHLIEIPAVVWDYKVAHGKYDLKSAWQDNRKVLETINPEQEEQVEEQETQQEAPEQEEDADQEEAENAEEADEEPAEDVELDDGITGILEDPDEVYDEGEIAFQLGLDED